MEAEHYSPLGGTTATVAGNGILVQSDAQAGMLFEIDGNWGYTLETTYNVFVRGRMDAALILQQVATNLFEVDTGAGFVGRNIDFTDQLEWRPAGFYKPTAASPLFHIRFAPLQGLPAEVINVDRVAILTMAPPDMSPVSCSPNDLNTDVDDALPDLQPTDVVEIIVDLPWGTTDPMEADTDGDGIRACDGFVEGSSGWLTDGHELLNVGSNPFDIGSDYDADLKAPRPRFGIYTPDNILEDTYAIETGIGTCDGGVNDQNPCTHDEECPDGSCACPLIRTSNCASPAPAPCDDIPNLTDNLDANPISSDSDGDGVLDPIEWDFCPFPFDCDLDGDRDDDGLTDGMEDLNLNGVFDCTSGRGELNLDYFDTDCDGIPDCVERGLPGPLKPEDTNPSAKHCLDLNGDGIADKCDHHPAGRTDPLSDDSDGDGLKDWEEDINRNGRYEPELPCQIPDLVPYDLTRIFHQCL